VCILAARNGDGATPTGARVHELAPRLSSFLGGRAGSPSDRPRFPASDTGNAIRPSRSPAQIARDIARVAWWKCWDRYFHQRARQAALRERPDFLYERYVRGMSAGSRLARELRLPLIVEMNTSFTFPGEWWEHHSAVTPWIVARAERQITAAADRVVVVSSHLRDHFLAAGVPEEKLVLMFNGADARRFRPDADGGEEIRTKHGLYGNRVIGFVGSLKPWHGVDVLISSLRSCVDELPDLRLVIVGDGPLRGSLEEIVRKAGLSEQVVFVGAVPYDRIPAYVAVFDIAVCPAPQTPSSHLSPIKLFEYMASARPVIAARFSDVPEIVKDHENGVLVDPGDAADMARAILELGKNPDLCKRLGDSARRDVERSYTWERNAERVMDLYGELSQRTG
jgi:glycosyltransferase involved in cell wall biosynthesis